MDRVKQLQINHLVIFIITVALSSIAAFAQTETARIQGNIADVSGGSVAGATITIKEIGTNRELKAQTNDEGDYVFVSVSPGRYQIEVTQNNFKTVKQEVTLQIQQVAVLNFSLQPGGISEVVNVEAGAPLVDSATSAIGDVITGKKITELPLNGRNVLELARLIPGVTQGVRNGFATGVGGNAETYRNGNTGGASLSVNGQRTQANNFMIDGTDNNESLVNTISIFPSADAVEEFKIQTSVAQAEYGRGGGAIVNTTIKSGKNRYSGSAYTFIRNDNFDATPAYPVGTKKNEFRRGQFGGTLGGPLYLPAFGEGGPFAIGGKDKLFFFASYEGLRQFLPSSTGRTTVPTAKMRTGDFSELLVAGNGAGIIQLVDPVTGLNILNNRIDLTLPGRINQAGLNYLNAFPLPNISGTTVNNYNWVMNQKLSSDSFDGKIDWNLNDKNQLNWRVNWSDWKQETTSRLPNLPAGFGSGSNPTETRSIAMAWNSAFTSTISNEMRVQAGRIRYAYEPPMGDMPVSRNLGFIWSNPDSLRYGGIAIGAYGDGGIEYTGDGGAYTVPQNTYQIVDSLTWVTGNHIFKFGANVVRKQVNIFQGNRAKGEFGFWSGDSLSTKWVQADMLIGFAQFYWAGSSAGMVGTRSWENGFFVQDDWKVSNKLTLNLGLRYDILTMPTEVYGRQANFDLTARKLIVAKDASDSLVDTDWGNIGPRIGFAYDLTGKTKSVIRGGYGLFYFLDRGGVANQLISNPPYRGSAQYGTWDGYRFTFTGTAPRYSNNPLAATAPLPVLGTAQSIDLNNPQNLSVLAILPDNKNSRTHQFDLQFQQEVWKNTTFTIGYVGNRSRNLTVYYNPNDNVVGQPNRVRPYGNGLNVTIRDDIGRSSYDSLQAKLERRLSDGIYYLASYTFSKTKDTSNGAWDNSYGYADVNNIDLNFGTSGIDFPHVFSFTSIYELPFGRGKKYGSDMNKIADAFIGGWQLTPVLRIQSGNPFDVRDSFGNLADLTGDPYTGEDSPYLNKAAFTWVPSVSGTVGTVPTRVGNLARNSLRMPTTWSLNLGLSKDFKFGEKTKIQFRSQAYNLTNTPQRRGLDTWVPSGTFGKWYENYDYSQRSLEFGLRLEF